MTLETDDLQLLMGQRLREARQRKNLSQTELSERLGRDPSTVSNYESGARAIRTAELLNIATVLEIPISFLFGDDFVAREASLSMIEWMSHNRQDILHYLKIDRETGNFVPKTYQLAEFIHDGIMSQLVQLISDDDAVAAKDDEQADAGVRVMRNPEDGSLHFDLTPFFGQLEEMIDRKLAALAAQLRQEAADAENDE